MKANSGATVEELQDFLRELNGKSPQEMLGVVASSHLVRSFSLAAVIVFAGIIGGTALPFALGGKVEPAEASTAPAGDPAPPVPGPSAPAPEPAPTAAPDADPPSRFVSTGFAAAEPAPFTPPGPS